MGGLGSGNWYRWNKRDVVEDYTRLDIRTLQQKGALSPGWHWWAWLNGKGETVASIQIHVQQGRVVLHYRSRRNGQDWQDREETVPITWTRCHFGGKRPWFLCPGVVNGRSCGRRVAVLYGGTYFLCRHCYNLSYESQREDRANRLRSKVQKIRLRLGGSANLLEWFPPKPKRMRWRTYERLREQAYIADHASLIAMSEKLSRLHGIADRLLERAGKTTTNSNPMDPE